MRKVPYYMAALIAGYLLLKNYKGAVAEANAGATGGVNLVKSLQGR